MSRLIVRSFSVSLDGFGAGPEQSLQDPMGRGGMALHDWVLHTPTFQSLVGAVGGPGPLNEGVDEDFARAGFENIGAWILGRHMFGPQRGPWPDDGWQGWWGDEPPYHVPVFVLTQHARPPLVMKGGTVFHFVTGGIHGALQQARQAAAGRDVRLGGGVATVRQYLQAGLLDEMHLALAPVLLGRGEALFAGLDLAALGWRVQRQAASAKALHVVLARG